MASFGPNAGYNVSWVTPIDTVASLSINAGRPRFYMMTKLGVAGQSIINGDSLTLASGILRTGHFLLGSGNPGKLLITATGTFGSPGAQLISADSVSGSYMGDGGSARVSIQGGGRLYGNAFLSMGFSHTDLCSTLVIGGSLLSGFSGLATMSALGGGKRGDVIVADSGTAVLQIVNGGFVNVVGDLFLGAHGGSGKVHQILTGTRGPSLTVHGQTYVGANADGPGKTHGTGTLLVERGAATLTGMSHIQQGGITVRNGALLTSGGDSLLSGTSINPTTLKLIGAGTVGNISDTLAIGTGTALGSNAILDVDSGAVLNVTGAGPFNVAPDGGLYLNNGTNMTSTAGINSKGECQVHGGTLQASALHLLGRTGLLDGYGTVAARVSVSDSAAIRCDAFGGPNGVLTVGDSTAADGFISTGTTTLVDDTLVVLSQGVAELGQMVINAGPTFKYSRLSVPHGGHFASDKTLAVHSDLMVFGPITNDGTIAIDEPQNLLIYGSLTQLGGQSLKLPSTTGFYGGGCYIDAAASLTARGKLEPSLNLWGSLDLGPTPAKLSTGVAGSVNGFNMQATTNIRFRIGSKASGIQDTLVDNNFVTLNGNLDLRSIPGHLPVGGDTLTILTSPKFNGNFATVTLDGLPGASWVSVLYLPNSVKIVMKKSVVGVAPEGPGGSTPLRLAGAGTLTRPEFALSLPSASSVSLRIYDVAGREVALLYDGRLTAGVHRLSLPSDAVSSGVYFARAEVHSGGSAGSTQVVTARVVRLR